MKLGKTTLKVLSVVLALAVVSVTVYATGAVKPLTRADAAGETADPQASSSAAEETPQETAGTLKKSETVYVTLDATGKPTEQIVTDWLHTDTPDTVVYDKSDLTGIRNIKGDAEPQQDGDMLRWQMEGTDLYYQGQSSKQLPLEVSISYKLDGKEMDPEEIAGKSGSLEMTVRFRNTMRHEVEIGGQKTAMYTPLMAVAAFSLPDDTFSNVSASDGTVLSDGNAQAVAFISMPGLHDSLNLGSYSIDEINDLDFPETFTVTADVTEFEMGPIMVVATAGMPALDELEKTDSIDDLRQDLLDLQQMQNDLERIDPERDIRSLLTNPARTEGAQTLVDDIFDFYDLNTDILDILPKYVTAENIRLYDRLNHDLKENSLDTLLDDETMSDILDLADDISAPRLEELIEDYETLEKKPELKRALETLAGAYNDKTKALLTQALKVYETSEADPALRDQALAAITELLKNPSQLNDAMLAQVREMVKAQMIGAIRTGGMDQQLAGLVETSDLDSATKARLENEIMSGALHGSARNTAEPKMTAVDPPKGNSAQSAGGAGATDGAASQPQDPPDASQTDPDGASSGQSPEPGVPDASSSTAEESGAGNSSSRADSDDKSSASSGSDPTDVVEVLGTFILADEPRTIDLPSDDPSTGGDGSDDGCSDGDGSGDSADAGDPSDNGSGEDSSGSDGSSNSSDTDGSGNENSSSGNGSSTPENGGGSGANGGSGNGNHEVLTASERVYYVEAAADYEADRYILEALVSRYVDQMSAEELLTLVSQQAPEKAQQIQGMQSLQAYLNKIGTNNILALLGQAVDCKPYLDGVLSALEQQPALKAYLDGLFTHIDENRDNIVTLKLLLRKMDDEDLLDLVKKYDDLREDLADARPLVKDLRRDLNKVDINKSLHQSPKTTDTLLKMKDDLEQFRDISETLRTMLLPENVETARSMISTLDRLEGEDATSSALDKVNDLDSLLERKDAYVDLSEQYSIYTAAPEGAETELKFIMKTDEIKKPEPVEQTEAPVEEKQGFTAWVKGLTKKDDTEQ